MGLAYKYVDLLSRTLLAKMSLQVLFSQELHSQTKFSYITKQIYEFNILQKLLTYTHNHYFNLT